MTFLLKFPLQVFLIHALAPAQVPMGITVGNYFIMPLTNCFILTIQCIQYELKKKRYANFNCL